MKRIVTLLLVLALAGTAATTAFAAQEEAAETITASAADESGPMYITTEGRGQVAVSIDGSEPVFDDEYPMQTATINPSVVDTVILGAKADEGWTFAYWINADTGAFYSADAVITVEVTGNLNLKAVFADDSLLTVTAIREGNGQIAISLDGSDPVFDDENPVQNAGASVSAGDTIILGAKADEGWNFVYWIKADTGEFYSADAVISVEVTGNLNLKAVFADASLLTVTAIREGNGQIAISLDGSDPVFDDENPVQNAGASVSAGDTIILGAKADEGWTFAYWINADTGEFYSADATITVEVTGNLNLKAVFADASLLSVTAGREGNGQVAISIDGSEPVFDDEHPMQSAAASAKAGDTLILGAKADEGWTFAYWINADTGAFYSADAIITVEVTGNLNLKAVFADASLLTVTAIREGNGQIAISLDGSDPVFDDENPMQNAGASVNVGDTIILGAKADEGWTFAYWINADTGEFYSADATITIEVTGNLNLKAVFADDSLMSVTASTEGNGQIAISLDGSDPEFDDEFPKQNVGASVNVGDTVIFGAKADEGWIFTGWRYADTNEFYSDKATISIEVTETLNLVAVFEEEMIVEPAEESSKPISPAVDTPKTGDTASAIAVSAVLLSSLTAALFLAMKRRKDEQE